MSALWLLALLGLTFYAASKVGVLVSRKHQVAVLMFYVAAALLSPLVLHWLPQARLAPIVDAASVTEARAAARDLLSAAVAGMPNAVAGVRQIGAWSYSLSGDKLTIVDAAPHLPVVIDRKAQRDGIVEVTLYGTSTIKDMVDMSKLFPLPVEMRFAGHTLTITQAIEGRIELIRFMPEASAEQIPTAIQPYATIPPVFVRGTQVVYIRIPSDMEIYDPAPSLLFVER